MNALLKNALTFVVDHHVSFMSITVDDERYFITYLFDDKYSISWGYRTGFKSLTGSIESLMKQLN